DDEGREQWLLGRYRAAALRSAAAGLGDPAGRPLRALLGGLDLARVRLPGGLHADVDTVADARRAGVVLPEGGTPGATTWERRGPSPPRCRRSPSRTCRCGTRSARCSRGTRSRRGRCPTTTRPRWTAGRSPDRRRGG